MTIGDAAQAAGYPLVPGTASVRDGSSHHNETRDLLAGVAADVGGQLANKQPALGFAPVQQGGGANQGGNKIYLGWGPNGRLRLQVDVTDLGDLAFFETVQQVANRIDGVQQGILSPDVYNRPISTAWRSLVVRSDGVLGFSTSSRRFKKNIHDAILDVGVLRAIRLRWFKYRAALNPDPDAVELGTIAEELHELGLAWLVTYDDDGQPFGVHYDRLSLAAVYLSQQAHDRLDALERRLNSKES